MNGILRQAIEGPFAWRGDALADDDWMWPLDDDEIADLDAALAAVKGRGLGWPRITRDDVPFGHFAATLARAADALERGPGVVRLRGLPVARYELDDLRTLFWAIGVHLGHPRYQNSAGELMGEVRDEVRAYGAVREAAKPRDGMPVSSRAKTRTSGPLRFHTDRCDSTGLLCVDTARAGGVHKLVSAVAVHNEILARRPDLLEVLYGDYWRSRVGEERGGEDQAYPLPVFACHDGHFTTQYSRTFVEAAQAVEGVPPMTDAQVAALDLLHEVAEELCVEAPFAPGDIQFFNNHVVYHARTAYEDPDAGTGRFLLRLWLSMPNSRPLPPGHAVLWGATGAGAPRGGIAQPR